MIFSLLVIGLLASAMFAQTPRSIPYTTSVFAGIANESSNNNPYTAGQACPSGKISVDTLGDGCLASEAVLYQPWAVVFDSAGNAYIADTNAGSYSYVRKVDATTGVISLFAGGLGGVVATPGPCGSYSDGNGHTGGDPAVTSLAFASATGGDGCPAVDPNFLTNGISYSYFKGIRDLAIDANYLYIADSSNSKVRKISLSSSPLPCHYYAHELEPVAGEGGSGWSADGPPTTVQIKNIYAVAVDTAGNVFFADQSGDAIRRATPTTYTSVGGVCTPTVGAILTVGNCAASGSTCTVQTNGDVCPTQAPGAGASRNMRFYNITGLAFDGGGNLYAADSKCYSVYKIANNGSNPIDGSTGMTTLMGNGATGAYAGGSWMQPYTGGAQSSTRGVTSAGGNNLYIINGTNAWFYDATDTANGATNGWIHEFWNSASPAGTGCTGSVGTPTATSYFGCPAPYSVFNAGSQGAHGSVDAHGNLYIADGNDALVLKAANGLDFAGTAPLVVASGPLTQTAMIHGASLAPSASGVTTVAQTNFTLASPFALAMDVDYPAGGPFTSACSQYNNNTNPTDDAQDCTVNVTYTPSAIGAQTGTLVANGTSLPVDGYGASLAPPSLTASVSCLDKVYDTTTATNGCVCVTAPVESNVSCGLTPAMSCTFASANVGSGIAETCTGIALSGSAASGYTLSNSTATTANNITVASPSLSATCPGGVYNGTAYSCTGSATGVGAATVTGTFAFAPGSETNAGSYPETGTFSSTNSNYASGGTASATLTITPATPNLALACGTVTANGSAQACAPGATANGIGGASVAGTFAYTYNGSSTVPSAAGTYTVVATFTSSDSNYVSGGTATGSFVINPQPTVAVVLSCAPVTYNGAAQQGCTATPTPSTATCSGLVSETNAGSYPESATCTNAGYTAGTGTGTLVINSATPTLTVICPQVTYNGSAQSCSGTATGVGGATVAGSFAFTPASETAAGSYAVTGAFTSTDPNYVSGGTSGGTLVIGQATPALAISCPAVNFDGTAHSCTATASGVSGAGSQQKSQLHMLAVIGNSVNGSFACSPATETNAGTYPVTCTFTSSDPNYVSGGTVGGSLVINAVTPTLSATCAGGVYNGTAYSCTGSATGVGGATVAGSFAFAPGSETAAGSYPETGTFTSSDPNYVSGGTASGTLVITAATPTLSATCTGGVYNGTAYSCTGTATGVGGAAVAGSFSFAPGSETNAGSYPETGTFTSSDPNYVSGGTASGTLTITAATPTLSAICAGGVYNGNQIGYSCTGTATGVGGAAVAGSFAGFTTQYNVGSWSEGGTFTSTDPNYVSGGLAAGILTITKATPTLSANCAGGVYSGTAYSCTGAATGVGGAAVAGSFAFAPGSETAAGSYAETGTFTSSNANYVSGGTASGTLIITVATPTLAVTCNPVAANGSPQACAPGGSATGIGGVAVAGSWTYTYNGSATVPTAAATYTVVGTFTSSNPNYSGGTASGSLVIGTEPVVAVSLSCPTVTFDGNSHACTATPTPSTASCSGLVTGTNAGSYPESVTCSNAGYQSGSATGTLVINAATPTLSATCAGGVYSGAAYSCTGSATGVGGAAVAGSFAFAPGSEINAGSYPETGTFTSSNANYVSGGTASSTLTITAATPALTVTCNTVTGNGNPQACAPGGSATGIGGAAVAGTFALTYNGSATVPSASATYAVVATFTSSNSNYVSGGTASGSFVIGAEPVVAVTLSCPAATYNGAAQGCTATATPVTAVCSGLVSETNAGSYPESVTCSNAGYTAGSATGTLVINAATPALTVVCTGAAYSGTAYSCVGSATGVGGATVVGTFAFNPGSETNAGSYPETGTFTSSNTNYASGGTASSTLTITAVAPTITVTCPTVTFDSNAHSCTATATGVGGATVSGTFAFAPGSETAAGSYPETATFTSTNANYTNGSGTGTLVINPVSAGTPAITLSASSVTFAGSIMIGQSAPAQYVQITSTGSASLQVSGVTIGGANPGDFLVTNQAGTCTTGATLVYHAGCNLRVVFAPTGVGARSAILYINDNASGSPQQVLVSGMAVTGAQYTLSASTLTFAPTTVGATAATQYITIKSTGYQPLVISQVVLSSGDFDLSDQAGTCTTAATTSLVPGADCNIRVKFHPTATGARTATVVINNNSATSPLTVTLNGTGE
jgi:hypothetical protein